MAVRLRILAALIVATAALAGCGGGSPTATGGTSSADTNAPAAASASAAAASNVSPCPVDVDRLNAATGITWKTLTVSPPVKGLCMLSADASNQVLRVEWGPAPGRPFATVASAYQKNCKAGTVGTVPGVAQPSVMCHMHFDNASVWDVVAVWKQGDNSMLLRTQNGPPKGTSLEAIAKFISADAAGMDLQKL